MRVCLFKSYSGTEIARFLVSVFKLFLSTLTYFSAYYSHLMSQAREWRVHLVTRKRILNQACESPVDLFIDSTNFVLEFLMLQNWFAWACIHKSQHKNKIMGQTRFAIMCAQFQSKGHVQSYRLTRCHCCLALLVHKLDLLESFSCFFSGLILGTRSQHAITHRIERLEKVCNVCLVSPVAIYLHTGQQNTCYRHIHRTVQSSPIS